MKTTATIYRPDGTQEVKEYDLPEDLGYDKLKVIIEPILDGAFLEHVSVLHNGQRADMFVDEEGMLKSLQRNEAATKIYRANWLSQHPETEPESMPYIAGTAILFDRLVWF